MDAEADYIAAHQHVNNNRIELSQSEKCGCFFCLNVFSPQEIFEWVDGLTEEDEVGTTALCPKCGIDAVIGAASGLALTEDFLQAMRRYWFK
jgi:hypothetical protein